LHRERRRAGWETHEAPLDLVGIIRELAQDAAPILVDCLTLWLSNLLLGGHDIEAAITGLESVLDDAWAPVVAVSNEVGLGIVPENALARRFRDEAGRLNQRLAARADRVLLMVAGLRLEVK